MSGHSIESYKYYFVNGEQFVDLAKAVDRAGKIAETRLRTRMREVAGNQAWSSRDVADATVSVLRDDGTVAVRVSPSGARVSL